MKDKVFVVTVARATGPVVAPTENPGPIEDREFMVHMVWGVIRFDRDPFAHQSINVRAPVLRLIVIGDNPQLQSLFVCLGNVPADAIVGDGEDTDIDGRRSQTDLLDDCRTRSGTGREPDLGLRALGFLDRLAVGQFDDFFQPVQCRFLVCVTGRSDQFKGACPDVVQLVRTVNLLRQDVYESVAFLPRNPVILIGLLEKLIDQLNIHRPAFIFVPVNLHT